MSIPKALALESVSTGLPESLTMKTNMDPVPSDDSETSDMESTECQTTKVSKQASNHTKHARGRKTVLKAEANLQFAKKEAEKMAALEMKANLKFAKTAAEKIAAEKKSAEKKAVLIMKAIFQSARKAAKRKVALRLGTDIRFIMNMTIKHRTSELMQLKPGPKRPFLMAKDQAISKKESYELLRMLKKQEFLRIKDTLRSIRKAVTKNNTIQPSFHLFILNPELAIRILAHVVSSPNISSTTLNPFNRTNIGSNKYFPLLNRCLTNKVPRLYYSLHDKSFQTISDYEASFLDGFLDSFESWIPYIFSKAVNNYRKPLCELRSLEIKIHDIYGDVQNLEKDLVPTLNHCINHGNLRSLNIHVRSEQLQQWHQTEPPTKGWVALKKLLNNQKLEEGRLWSIENVHRVRLGINEISGRLFEEEVLDVSWVLDRDLQVSKENECVHWDDID